MLEGKSILVADDNKLNQKILIFVLQKTGANVVTVSNGVEAVEQIKKNKFDAVLMDVQMPEMNGLEATAYIKNVLKSNVPIIGLTANTLHGENMKCIDAGMVACASKPFEPAELCNLIAQIIEQQNTLQ